MWFKVCVFVGAWVRGCVGAWVCVRVVCVVRVCVWVCVQYIYVKYNTHTHTHSVGSWEENDDPMQAHVEFVSEAPNHCTFVRQYSHAYQVFFFRRSLSLSVWLSLSLSLSLALALSLSRTLSLARSLARAGSRALPRSSSLSPSTTPAIPRSL
jgi:hypothetical protein